MDSQKILSVSLKHSSHTSKDNVHISWPGILHIGSAPVCINALYRTNGEDYTRSIVEGHKKKKKKKKVYFTLYSPLRNCRTLSTDLTNEDELDQVREPQRSRYISSSVQDQKQSLWIRVRRISLLRRTGERTNQRGCETNPRWRILRRVHSQWGEDEDR